MKRGISLEKSITNANIEIKKAVEREARVWGSAALYNNLLLWANEKNYNLETLKKALDILDDIILNEYKEEFLIKIPVGEVFYRARTIDIADYGNIEKGIHSSTTRLFGYNWDESKEPPAKYASNSRNSKKKEQALYVASNEITACTEARPPIRSFVSIAKFIVNNEMMVIDFSKLKYSRPLNNKDSVYGVDTRTYIGKVISLFYSPVYDKEDYRITQKLIEHFREKGYYGFKYRSFYADGYNFTFFDEYMNNFIWEESRVVLNYATANIFISLDKEENHFDIENINKVQGNVSSELREKMWDDVSKAWKFKLPIDEFLIADTMKEAIMNNDRITQKELAQITNSSVTKVRSIQGKLKAAGIIQHRGYGKNGYWIWNEKK